MNTNFDEIFDIKKAQYIIEKYDDIKHNFREESEQRLKNMNIDPLTLFKKYVAKSKKGSKKGTKKVNVSYKQNNNIGRYFACGSLSLQTLPREIRHTIANDYYYDIDISNCHPVLICQYAKSKSLKCKYIQLYIDNRDTLFEELSNEFKCAKDKIKNGFLCILNGAKSFLKMNDDKMPSFVKKYKKEVTNIQQYIFENEPEYKKLGIANAKKKQEQNNYNCSNELGSTMNIMLCDIENRILQCMVSYLDEKELVKSCLTLVFDGFMIPKDNVKNINMDELLKELEQEVLTELGYEIKLVVKPMNNVISIPDDYKEESQETMNIIKNDGEAADKVLSLLDNCIYNCNNTVYFKNNNVWIDNKKTIDNLLKNIIMEQSFVKHIKATKEDIKEGCTTIIILGVEYCEHKFEYYSSDTKGANNILSALVSKIPINNKLLDTVLKSSKNKIFFNNGYYNFIQRKFINNFDGVETLIKIDRDFEECNTEQQQKIKMLIFKPVFDEDTDEALLLFSRAMAGHVEDKLWSIMLGSRDSGKGIIQDSLWSAFGDYVGGFNADSLMFEKNGGDAAKKLSWAYHFDKKRLAFSNEMKVDNTIKLDGNLIKKLCSGGDKIIVRQNNVDEKTCNPQTTVVFCCNDIPKIEPNDVYEKLIPFSLKSKFVEEEITPELLKENPYYKKSDENLRTKVNNEEWIINGVTNLIINSYNEKKVKLNDNMKDQLEAFKSGDDVFDKLNASFEITRNEKDRLDNNVMKEFLKISELNISFPKVVNLYMSKGINNKVCKIDGVSKRAFIGLKQIFKSVLDNDDENDFI